MQRKYWIQFWTERIVYPGVSLLLYPTVSMGTIVLILFSVAHKSIISLFELIKLQQFIQEENQVL